MLSSVSLSSSAAAAEVTSSHFKYRGEKADAEASLRRLSVSLLGPLNRLRLHYRHLDERTL